MSARPASKRHGAGWRALWLWFAGAVVLIDASAHADYPAAWRAYENGDHETAVAVWLDHARQGDIDAQYNVAAAFESGKGIAQDLEVAAGWYHKAAAHGLAWAQFRLGLLHAEGAGVARDLSQAMAW